MLPSFDPSWLLLIPLYQWAIRIGMVITILRQDRSPSESLGWLTLTFLLPEVGLALYLLVGANPLIRKRVRQHAVSVDQSRRVGDRRQNRHPIRPHLPEGLRKRYQPLIKQAEQVSGNPIVGGNALELLRTNDDVFERLIPEIDAAEHHVHLLYYIARDDDVGRKVWEAVRRAAERGVQCRVLADTVGSAALLRNAITRELREAGAHVVGALPVKPWRRKLSRIDLRNHRKIAVVDGRVAYTGSHNLCVDSYGTKNFRWIDLSGRYTGPLVRQLQQVFVEDWKFETDETLAGAEIFPEVEACGAVAAHAIPTGPSYEAETFRRVVVSAFNQARERIVLTTPYLVLDEPTFMALAMAVGRGVRVQVAVPARGDHPLVGAAGRYYYAPLMRAGAELYEYAGGLLHAKTITVDDAVAVLGSANMDIRSFFLNFELSVLMYGPEVTQRLRAEQERYLDGAHRIELEAWLDRPAWKRYAERVAALASPLL